MDLGAAQREMASAMVGGAPGVLVSGLAWLAAGLVWMRFGVEIAFAALFVGGMLIVPASMVIERFVFGAPRASPDNPLQRLGLESTFVLFAGLLVAYILLRIAPEFVFPILAIIVGARYFVFRTLYGEPAYWALGALLGAIGIVAALRFAPLPINPAVAVGLIEIGFAGLLLARWKRRKG